MALNAHSYNRQPDPAARDRQGVSALHEMLNELAYLALSLTSRQLTVRAKKRE